MVTIDNIGWELSNEINGTEDTPDKSKIYDERYTTNPIENLKNFKRKMELVEKYPIKPIGEEPERNVPWRT